MGEGTTVDSLQIEIEASSGDAVKKVNELVDALKRLKSQTHGFGNVAERIREIGNSARGTGKKEQSKTEQKREALERAARQPASAGFDAVKMSKQLRSIDSEIDKTTQKLEKMDKQLESLQMKQDIGPPNTKEEIAQIRELEEEIERYSELLGGLYSQRRRLNESAVKIQTAEGPQQDTGANAQIEETTSRWHRLKEAINSANSSLEKFLSTERRTGEGSGAKDYGLDSLRTGLAGIIQMAGEAGSKVASALGNGVKIASVALGSGLKTATSALGSGVKNVAKNIGKWFSSAASEVKKLTASLAGLVKNGVDKATSGLKSLAVSLGQRMISPITKTISAWQNLQNRLMRITFMRALRAAIRAVTEGFKEGVNNIYQYSKAMGTSLAPAMDSLATSAQYLKNSLGAMVSPLIEAIAPVVEYLVNKFVELLNIIGKVFAALTGKKTFSQAVRVQKEYAAAAGQSAKANDEAADAVDDYAEAVKNYSLGIDELNVFEPDVDTDKSADKLKDALDGLGGAGGPDYGSMFEEVEIPNEISEWAERIREAIANGDWYSVGAIVAEKLNEIVESWDSYAWGNKLGGLITNGLNVAFGFLKTFDFAQFGAKIAQGLNGLFDGVDWDLLGRTVAAKWNALFDFVYGFAVSLNWGTIGDSIAGAINGFLDEIDPSRAAAAASEFVNGIFESLNKAISKVNWGVLSTKLNKFVSSLSIDGSKIGKTLQSSLKAINTTIRNFDFEGLGEKLSGLFTDAIEEINPQTLGSTLSSKWDSAIDFAYGVITGLDFSKFGAWLGQAVNGWFTGIDWSKAANTVVGGITGIFDSLLAMAGAIDWGRVAESIRGFLVSGFKSAENWLQQVDWDAVGDNAWKSLKDAVQKLKFGDIAKSFYSLFGVALGAGVSLLKGAVSGVIEDIKKYFLGFIKDENNDGHFGAYEIINGLLDGIVDALKGIAAWIKTNMFYPFINGFKSAFQIHSPSKVMEEMGRFIIEGLLNGIKDAWDGVVAFFTEKVPEWFENNVKPWFSAEKWKEVTKSIGESINGAWQSMAETWGKDIAKWWNEGVAPWFTAEKWLGIGKNAVDGLMRGMDEVFGKALDWGQGLVDKVKEALGIASPSKEFRKIGEFAVMGLEKGFEGMDMSEEFTDGLFEMIKELQKFSENTTDLVNVSAANFMKKLDTAKGFNEKTTSEMTGMYQNMANRSNAFIQSIITSLNSIPRNITTTHTIMTKTTGGTETQAVNAYASGGFPEIGQMFIAREAGPELVGSIGNRTAVANNEDIVQSVSQGVENANEEQNALLREQNELLRAILSKDNSVVIGNKAIKQAYDTATRQSGASIMVGGVIG